MKYSSSEATTSLDLSQIIQNGWLLRVGTQYLAVISCTVNHIVFNRRWRGRTTPSYQGEVMYRLPFYNNERGRLYYYLRYRMYDVVVKNYLSKLLFNLHYELMMKLSKLSKQTASLHQRIGLEDSYVAWRRTALRFQHRAKWSNQYRAEAGGIDMSDYMSSKEKKPSQLPGKTTVKSTKTRTFMDVEMDVETNPYILELLSVVNVDNLGVGGKDSNQFKDMLTAIRHRSEGDRWYATKLEKEYTRIKESLLPREELAKQYHLWTEEVDIITENIFYRNKETNELSNELPGALKAKQDIEEEEAKTKALHDEAQKVAKVWRQKMESKVTLKSKKR